MKGKTSKQLHEEWKIEGQANLSIVKNAICYRLNYLNEKIREKYLLPEFIEEYQKKYDKLKDIYDALTG